MADMHENNALQSAAAPAAGQREGRAAAGTRRQSGRTGASAASSLGHAWGVGR